MKELDDIVRLLERLRSEKGCPWDRAQTIETLRKDLREEFEEVIQAIDKRDHENLKEEIGDLIWTLLLMVQIASEGKMFDARDVLKNTRDKIIRRHPHVFSRGSSFRAVTPKDAIRAFNEAKERERNGLRKSQEKTCRK